ncbi:MAG: alpha/beta hydrolase [Gemmatimonadaceae bacterium]|nr:alpha/beta hydrolase [Gemmatimonadaceae bacterium]
MTHPSLSAYVLDVGGGSVFTRAGGGVPTIGSSAALGNPDGGDGMPIVMVHGAVISGRYMVPTARRLAVMHRVLIPDLPGFGASDDPAQPLDVPGLAGALHDWMAAAGIGRAHLLGNSMGAQVIADLAVRWPDAVASLVLVGPTVDRAARTRMQQLWRLAHDAFLERPSLIPLHLRDIVRAGWRFATSALDIALDDRIEEKLAHVRAPVLIVCGDRDPLAPQAWCRWLGTQSPTARLEILEGPHALNYSRPAELAECVERWIDELR